jgi:hypothetical protein
MQKMLKIRFAVNDLISGETLWAEDIGSDLFRLANIPFYVTGYAIDDVVRCTDENGWKQVLRLEKDSGNGTVRLIFNVASDSEKARQVLDELKSVDCSIEIASSRLVAVNIPPGLEIPFSQLSNYLNSLSHEILAGWEVAKRSTNS